MSTIMPDSKKVREAIEWVDYVCREGRSLKSALQEVGMRFNLGPKDERFVRDFFSGKGEGDGRSG
ncbi:MAG: hypothetical protein ACLFSY_04330 [Desulfonatronovibrionaceae bacterium]